MKFPKILIHLLFLIFLNSCGHLFEVDSDVQARQALLDLMKIQDQFYKENQRYATRLGEIEKYNLKYHPGIVYLEIESAGKDKYRAISLPAESTTARVFAYDSDEGGYYEMEQDEVSRYVLGALRHIRDERQKRDLNHLTGWILIGGMGLLGFRFFIRYRSKENNPIIWAYAMSLPALGWSVALLGNMESNIIVTSTILQFTYGYIILSLIALTLGAVWFQKNKKNLPTGPLLSLVACTIGIALLSTGVMVHIIKTFG
jgi:hypothetical protein